MTKRMASATALTTALFWGACAPSEPALSDTVKLEKWTLEVTILGLVGYYADANGKAVHVLMPETRAVALPCKTWTGGKKGELHYPYLRVERGNVDGEPATKDIVRLEGKEVSFSTPSALPSIALSQIWDGARSHTVSNWLNLADHKHHDELAKKFLDAGRVWKNIELTSAVRLTSGSVTGDNESTKELGVTLPGKPDVCEGEALFTDSVTWRVEVVETEVEMMIASDTSSRVLKLTPDANIVKVEIGNRTASAILNPNAADMHLESFLWLHSLSSKPSATRLLCERKFFMPCDPVLGGNRCPQKHFVGTS